MGYKTTRREFLKKVAVTGATIYGLPAIANAAEADGKSRVIVATDKAAINSDAQVNTELVGKMLDASIAKLTRASSGSAGWKQLFKPNDIVGIKVNCLFGKGVSTRPEVVQAIIAGLKSAGVPEDNIIVWDRGTNDLIKAGFLPNKDGAGVKYFGDDGDWGAEIEQGSFKGRITKVISDKVTAIINAPILKTHRLAGISCCLKNHYGSFDNPGNHHNNHCNPALADFNSIPMVKDKTRLVVIDALHPQYDGGPGLKADSQFDNYQLITALDPVAADYTGLQIIQAQREKMKLDRIGEEVTAWLRSAQERGIGICDPGKIEKISI